MSGPKFQVPESNREGVVLFTSYYYYIDDLIDGSLNVEEFYITFSQARPLYSNKVRDD